MELTSAAHVAEGTLAGARGTATGHTGNTSDGTTSAP
jgi:hypothetical protein